MAPVDIQGQQMAFGADLELFAHCHGDHAAFLVIESLNYPTVSVRGSTETSELASAT